MIAIQRHDLPVWYRVRLVRLDVGSTLELPLKAHSLEEARLRAMQHYGQGDREGVEILEVRRLASLSSVA